MRFKFFALVSLAALVLAPVALAAEANCCDKPDMSCCDDKPCCDMPCCQQEAAEPDAVDVLFAMDQNRVFTLSDSETPTVQTAVVWFHRPVWVGNRVLMGKYIIEHDNDRMARGEPCTHIYAADDRSTPVVAFHCTHLEREEASQATVVLQSLPDGMRKLLEFQFAGETASHGFPTGR